MSNKETKSAHVTPLTPAQVKAGLIAAAESGLIDGTEINLIWFQSLQIAIRKATKGPSNGKKSGKSQKEGKGTKATQQQVKKTSPVVTGFLKMTQHLTANLPGVNPETSVKDLIEKLRAGGPEVVALRRLFLQRGWIDAGNDYKSGLAPEEYQAVYNGWNFTADESKAARTYFPYLGRQQAVAPRDFWEAGN